MKGVDQVMRFMIACIGKYIKRENKCVRMQNKIVQLLLKKDLKNIKNIKGCRDGMPKSMRTR